MTSHLMIGHRPRTLRFGALAFVLALAAAACGDDDTSTTSGETSGSPEDTSRVPGQEDMQDVLEGALLTEADLPGWTASPGETTVGASPCLDPGEEAGDVARGSVEFGRDSGDGSGETFGVFHDVVAFPDESAVRGYMDAIADDFEDCLRTTSAEDNQLTVASVVPLPLAAIDVVDALGWSVGFEPDPVVGELVTGLEIVFVPRGRFVATLVRFLPVASDVDLEPLGDLAYGRLPS